MTIINMLAASAAGALLFSSGALGAPPRPAPPPKGPTNVSNATCTVIAIGYSEGKNQELTVSAAASAVKYLCDGTGSVTDIATQTAKAYAAAVTSVVADCVLIGDASASINAVAEARAKAEIWVSSYFGAMADVSCAQCGAWASSGGYIEKYVFLEAIAKSQIKLDAFNTATSLKPLVISATSFQKDVETVVVTAFASALADAYTYNQESGCIAWVNAGGCIWTEGHPDEQTYCAECTAIAYSEGAVVSIDAIAVAGASASAWSCGDSVTIDEAYDTAKALGKATAAAFSLAYASCVVDEGGYACASAGTEISVWVEAVVRAWASVWAGAHQCDANCAVNVDVVVDAVAHILVDAATEAYAALCTGPGQWTVTAMEEQINTKYGCAIAEASALAISAPDGCLAAGIVYAAAGPCPGP